MRAVVTVTGTDRRGIIAKVSGFLYEHNINIEDISQTILGEQFAMIMMVDRHERPHPARRHLQRHAQHLRRAHVQQIRRH